MQVEKIPRRFPSRPYSLNKVDQLPESLLDLAKKYLPSDQSVEKIFVIPPDAIPKSSRRRKPSQELHG